MLGDHSVGRDILIDVRGLGVDRLGISRLGVPPTVSRHVGVGKSRDLIGARDLRHGRSSCAVT